MRIGIFGTGSAYKDFLSILPPEHTIVALADNNPLRQGQQVEGYQVVSAEMLVKQAPELVIIAARAVDELRAQLQSLGMQADKIHAYYPSYSRDLGRRVNEDISGINAIIVQTRY